MSHLVPILAILSSLFVLGTTLELVRRTRLRAQYALLWLLGAGIILLISIFWGTLASLAGLLGIERAPWLLLVVVGFLLTLITQASHTMIISKLAENNRDLAQRIAISDWHIRQLRQQVQQLSSIIAGEEQDPSRASFSLGLQDLENQLLEEPVIQEETVDQ